MAKTKANVKELDGISIYHDAKQRVIYSPFFSKIGYVLHDENVYDYQNYIQSYLVSILVFMAMFYLTNFVSYSFLLAFVYIVVSNIVFYVRCLKKAPKLEQFNKPKKEKYIIKQAKQITTRKLIVIIISCFLLPLFILLNCNLQQYTGKTLIINIIFSILTILYGVLNIIILCVKKKNKF